jgi:Asp/Glu/hydantoin racemase
MTAGPARDALLKGGRTTYGIPVGILMLDTRFPRPPGDVGNARTWPFPVRYRIVKGAESRRVIGTTDPALLQPFIDAARELERDGVAMITTSCGFLAIFQREMQAAVGVPMLTSSLLQVPLAARLVGGGKRVAIMTSRDELTERHYTGTGWSSKEIPVVVSVLPQDAQMTNVYSSKVPEAEQPEADPEVLERELVDAARRTAREHADVAAIVLECTNYVPYATAIRRAVELPVFDLYTLVMQTYLATSGTEFPRVLR